jgi:thiamine-phosphate pyrophosphorylase
MYSRLQYISQGETSGEQLRNICSALDAGCDWIQLRFKQTEFIHLCYVAEKVKPLCRQYKATFIINDNIEVAREVDADGVHLGLQDASPVIAREILGFEKIIGGTANTLEDILKRVNEKCDYVGLGPFKFTTTKKNLSPTLGLEGYHNIIDELNRRGISMPVYAIGGIEANDIEALMDTGIYGIAVSGFITHNFNKKELVNNIKQKLYAIA